MKNIWMYNFKKKERYKRSKGAGAENRKFNSRCRSDRIRYKALNQEKRAQKKARNQVRKAKNRRKKNSSAIKKQRNQLQPIINSIDKELKEFRAN